MDKMRIHEDGTKDHAGVARAGFLVGGGNKRIATKYVPALRAKKPQYSSVTFHRVGGAVVNDDLFDTLLNQVSVQKK